MGCLRAGAECPVSAKKHPREKKEGLRRAPPLPQSAIKRIQGSFSAQVGTNEPTNYATLSATSYISYIVVDTRSSSYFTFKPTRSLHHTVELVTNNQVSSGEGLIPRACDRLDIGSALGMIDVSLRSPLSRGTPTLLLSMIRRSSQLRKVYFWPVTIFGYGMTSHTPQKLKYRIEVGDYRG